MSVRVKYVVLPYLVLYHAALCSNEVAELAHRVMAAQQAPHTESVLSWHHPYHLRILLNSSCSTTRVDATAQAYMLQQVQQQAAAHWPHPTDLKQLCSA